MARILMARISCLPKDEGHPTQGALDAQFGGQLAHLLAAADVATPVCTARRRSLPAVMASWPWRVPNGHRAARCRMAVRRLCQAALGLLRGMRLAAASAFSRCSSRMTEV